MVRTKQPTATKSNQAPKRPWLLLGGSVGPNQQPTNGGRLLFFDVLGTPKATPRVKASVRGKGKMARAHIYTPSVADEWKHEVRAAALHAIQTDRTWGRSLVAPGVAVAVFIAFRFQRPKSHLRTGRHSGKLRSSAPRFHTQTPDKDNLEKAVLDALGTFDKLPRLVWCDDCQVVDGRVTKRWARPGEEPGAVVALWEIQE